MISGVKKTTVTHFPAWDKPLAPPRPVPKPETKRKGRPPKEK